jgi:hypothetical protein
MSFKWVQAPSQAWDMRLYVKVIGGNTIAPIFERYAGLMDAYAKANAPWTDRTKRARSGLSFKVVKKMDGSIAVIGTHKMYYGKYLEDKNRANPEIVGSGKYAIILPTIEHFQRELWEAVSAAI